MSGQDVHERGKNSRAVTSVQVGLKDESRFRHVSRGRAPIRRARAPRNRLVLLPVLLGNYFAPR